jgi:hypothetical protein
MIVRCNKCYWGGAEEELLICYEDDDSKREHPFEGCPLCKTDAYLMDINNNKIKKDGI